MVEHCLVQTKFVLFQVNPVAHEHPAAVVANVPAVVTVAVLRLRSLKQSTLWHDPITKKKSGRHVHTSSVVIVS